MPSRCRLSANDTLMAYNKAGFCDRSDHSTNLNRAEGHSPGLQETQGKQPGWWLLRLERPGPGSRYHGAACGLLRSTCSAAVGLVCWDSCQELGAEGRGRELRTACASSECGYYCKPASNGSPQSVRPRAGRISSFWSQGQVRTLGRKKPSAWTGRTTAS